MIQTLAIANYRTLLDFTAEVGALNLIIGANGSGKSNFYRALRLLAETAQGGVVQSLAQEGGLSSAFWAGPEQLSRRMRKGEAAVEGAVRKGSKFLRLGFAGDPFSYAITLGLPMPSISAFALDPVIKHEAIWAGPVYRPSAILVERTGPVVKLRDEAAEDGWRILDIRLAEFDSLFSVVADPEAAPEVFQVRESIRAWRFYDHFRTDRDAPARQPQLGTRTPVLHHDGRDLAAAVQTIREIGDGRALDAAVADAFPGARLEVVTQADGRFTLEFHQEGLLRPLTAAELSDGTLRYLLWVAALLSPRPPRLMVLNEPETSLHPDLLPALGRLIRQAAGATQVWVVSHAPALIATLSAMRDCRVLQLEKELGATRVADVGPLEGPPWHWAKLG